VRKVAELQIPVKGIYGRTAIQEKDASFCRLARMRDIFFRFAPWVGFNNRSAIAA
jgi:hypothetical protein